MPVSCLNEMGKDRKVAHLPLGAPLHSAVQGDVSSMSTARKYPWGSRQQRNSGRDLTLPGYDTWFGGRRPFPNDPNDPHGMAQAQQEEDNSRFERPKTLRDLITERLKEQDKCLAQASAEVRALVGLSTMATNTPGKTKGPGDEYLAAEQVKQVLYGSNTARGPSTPWDRYGAYSDDLGRGSTRWDAATYLPLGGGSRRRQHDPWSGACWYGSPFRVSTGTKAKDPITRHKELQDDIFVLMSLSPSVQQPTMFVPGAGDPGEIMLQTQNAMLKKFVGRPDLEGMQGNAGSGLTPQASSQMRQRKGPSRGSQSGSVYGSQAGPPYVAQAAPEPDMSGVMEDDPAMDECDAQSHYDPQSQYDQQSHYGPQS
ncbi:hypothetical protein LTR62_005259 [Meristemomyces frigidus]|uniref:Uncharacterized protein n=1 Tax=Meristemomyces frigidus TaxID=1508187 RepID=A0AAN7YJH2_9PEZI|nr:hypothetical protein LTR62_005259 [Meristemomyces frigidus]